MTGGAEPTPVPLSAIFSGDPASLSLIVTAAVNAPLNKGVMCPWIVQLAPAARLVTQLLANTNEDASAPVTDTLVIVSAVAPVLVTVTYCDALG